MLNIVLNKFKPKSKNHQTISIDVPAASLMLILNTT